MFCPFFHYSTTAPRGFTKFLRYCLGNPPSTWPDGAFCQFCGCRTCILCIYYIIEYMLVLRHAVAAVESSAMRIALIAHDSRKELMAQFCTAYVRILSENDLVATGVTGKIVHDATGLPGARYPGGRGGAEQIAAMIGCGGWTCCCSSVTRWVQARRAQRHDAAAPVRYARDPGCHQHCHRRGPHPRPGDAATWPGSSCSVVGNN